MTAPSSVSLEIGHNEIGDADDWDLVPLPEELHALFTSLSLPLPDPIRVMKIEHQIAQKLHGVSDERRNRPHDLIDLQLIMAHHTVDLAVVREICHQLFYYRHKQPWPAHIEKGDGWQTVYDERRGNLDVIPSVDDAIAWAHALVDKIEHAIT